MSRNEDLAESTALYERYGKPLEADHWGQFLAVSPSGQTLIGPTLLAVVQRATEELGPETHVFKIGPRAVGTIG